MHTARGHRIRIVTVSLTGACIESITWDPGCSVTECSNQFRLWLTMAFASKLASNDLRAAQAQEMMSRLRRMTLRQSLTGEKVCLVKLLLLVAKSKCEMAHNDQRKCYSFALACCAFATCVRN